MSNSLERILELSVLHLLMIVCGFSICCLGLYEWREQQCFAKFIPVKSTIISSSSRYTNWRGLYSCHSDVVFEYQTPNGTTKRDQICFLPTFIPNPLTNSVSRNVCYRLLYLYPEWGDFNHWDKYWLPGQVFTLYVNPNNPNEWSLDHGPNREAYLTLGVGVVLICGVVYLIHDRATRRS